MPPRGPHLRVPPRSSFRSARMSALLFARIGSLDNAREAYSAPLPLIFSSVSKVGQHIFVSSNRLAPPPTLTASRTAAPGSNLLRFTHEIEQADRFRRREESRDHRAEGPDPVATGLKCLRGVQIRNVSHAPM